MKRIAITSFLVFSLFSGWAQAPALGTASGFALFTVTGAFNNVGTSLIWGDVGTNAGAYTGNPTITGTVHIADAASGTAATDVNNAYTEMSAITCGSIISATLNGQTLVAGTYCVTSAATLNGNITLDAQGVESALFIIKINGALTTTTLSNVLLVNGAKTNNVYWQINGLFDLATSCVFRGTAIVNGELNFHASSVYYGRAFSKTGAINIESINMVYFNGGLWNGTVSTSISNAMNWAYKELPGTNYPLTISEAAVRNNVLDTNYSIRSLTNLSAMNLDLNGHSLTLAGAISHTSTGRIVGSQSGSTLILADTNLQLLPSNTFVNEQISNLTIDNTSGVTVQDTVYILESLTLTDGNLATGDFLFLSSNVNGTAVINEITGGSITGKIIAERYIAANGRKYRFLSSPVTSGTTLQWRDNGDNRSGIGTHITGLAGTVDASLTNQTSAFLYDESDVTGGNDINHSTKWDALDGNSSLTNGKGYRVFIRGDRSIDLFTVNTTNNTTKLWVSGEHPSTSVTLPLTYTTTAALGWNLVGNPYPATLDWDEVNAQSAASFNNLDNAIYVWNPLNTTSSGGGYASYVNGVGSGTPFIGTRYISSWQGFFVKANAASPVLVMRESHKIQNQTGGQFFKKSGTKANSLRIQILQNGIPFDDAVVYFESGASSQFDAKYDAIDLTGGLGFLTSDKSIALAISGSPELADSASVNLNVEVITGTYQMVFGNLNSFVGEQEIFLIDQYLSSKKQIHNADTITFSVDQNNGNSFGKNRFELAFGKSASGMASSLRQVMSANIFPNPVQNSLQVQFHNWNTGSYSWSVVSLTGAEILHGFSMEELLVIPTEQLPAGFYFFTWENSNSKGSMKFVKLQ